MILWAYFATVTTDPGQVPAGWIPFADEQVRAAIQAREAGPPSVQQHLRGPATSHQRSSAHIIVRCAMRSKHGRSWSALRTATTSSVRKGADALPGCRSADVDSMAQVYPRVMPHAAIALAACGFWICRSERPPATTLLQEVSGVEARACAPLLRQWPLYTQDGPLLYMGGQLRGAAELQGASQSCLVLYQSASPIRCMVPGHVQHSLLCVYAVGSTWIQCFVSGCLLPVVFPAVPVLHPHRLLPSFRAADELCHTVLERRAVWPKVRSNCT